MSKAGISDLLWPTLAEDEAIRRHLPEGFDSLSLEQQEHAYVVADLKAKDPGRTLAEIERDMDATFCTFLSVLGGMVVLVSMMALILG